MGWELAISHGMLVLAFLAGLLTLGRLLRQRRSPQSALAWIGFAILLPYVAVPLYFLLGRRKLRAPGPHRGREGADPKQPLLSLLSSFDVPPVRGANRLRLCTTGQAAHEALVALIEGARESLELEIFILHLDAAGSDVLERLVRRASEGVRVRLLLDGLGCLTTWPWKLRALTRAGGSVAFFHPLLRPTWWARANLRNHRKILIADRETVLAGGINIADEYVGPEPSGERWTDLAFLVQGPVVGDYQRILEADWAYATGTSAPLPPTTRAARPGEARLQVLPSGPDVTGDALQAALLQAVYAATRRIWIVTPYFLPDSELLQALAVAARRGVEVRIIVPQVSNHRVADWARGPYLRELENQGAQVRLFEAGMLHAKAILVDDEVAMLGSANLDIRSLYLDFEVMMLVHDTRSVKEVEGWIRGLEASISAGSPEIGTLREIFEGAVRLLAPLL